MTETRQTCEWTVTGMDCASCATKLKGAVGRLPGVADVEVSLMAERLRLTLDESSTPRNRIETVVKSLGYGILPKGTAPQRRRFVLPGELPEGGSPAGQHRSPADDPRTEAPEHPDHCLLYTSPSPRDGLLSRMPSSA